MTPPNNEEMITAGRAIRPGTVVSYIGATWATGKVLTNDGYDVRIAYSGGVASWSVLEAGRNIVVLTDPTQEQIATADRWALNAGVVA